MVRKYQIIDTYIEIGIYLYIAFIFLSKGEGIRNILLFGNFFLWLFSLEKRKNLYILKQPLSILFWIFLGSTLLSSIFSLDIKYSFLQLKNEPLKSFLIFPVFSTVLTDQKRFYRICIVCLITAIIFLLNGYYSYIFENLPLLNARTWLIDEWYNKYSYYLTYLLPFVFILFILWKKPGGRIFIAAFFLFAILALILNMTRTGILAFIVISLTWLIYFSKMKHYNFKKALIGISIIIFLISSVAWSISPSVREKVMQTKRDISTFNNRTIGWTSAIYAFHERPLVGWGYGKDIFHLDKPFQNTPSKKHPDIDDPHNTFLMVLFHQGIVGLIPYVLLILSAIFSFWNEGIRANGVKRYILIACVSVIIGDYIVYAFFNPTRFYHITVVLSIGVAAKNLHENSNP